uniref:Major facilitator superfamily (MFS) profile domain-containing protein n=1 Tax=Hippocampus comes TaxID=109280 RepID=A0A3Q2Z6S4_HIPCM
MVTGFAQKDNPKCSVLLEWPCESDCMFGGGFWPFSGTVWSEARKWMPVLFVGTCLLYCARMTMPVCVVAMAATFRWNKIESGLALGGFFWGYSCTQILGGHASDKIGGERVLLFSATSWAVVTASTPALAHFGSRTLALMTMARVFMGILQGVFFPSLASLIAQRAPEGEKSFLNSIMQSGSSLGILLAGLLGSVLLDRYGWESVFYAVGLLSGFWALVVWQCFLKGAYSRQHLCFSQLLAMVLAHLCTCGTSYTLLSWMPTYFHEEYPHATMWVYNVFPWAAAIPAALCGGYLSDSLISQGYSVAFVRKSMQVSVCSIVAITLVVFTYPLKRKIHVCFTCVGASVNVQDLTPSRAGALFGDYVCRPGVLMVSLSGYMIEVTQSWASVFYLIAFVHCFGLAVFLYFGDAQRVDLSAFIQ